MTILCFFKSEQAFAVSSKKQMRALDLNISQTNAKFSQLALQLAKNLTEC